ncbi:hypothetical protein RYX36_017619, partial [Vicia faba]
MGYHMNKSTAVAAFGLTGENQAKSNQPWDTATFGILTPRPTILVHALGMFIRVCGNSHGLIRKYGLMCCRQCFHNNAKEIGFIK